MALDNNYITGNPVTAEDIDTYNLGNTGGPPTTATPNVNTLFAQGTVGYGYGQTSIVHNILTGTSVTVSNGWGDLINTLEKMLLHQGQPHYTPGAGVPTVFQKIHALEDFEPALLQAWAARLNCAAAPQAAIPFSASINSQWVNKAFATFNIAFGSYDQARYYFNNGGLIEFSIGQSSGGSTIIVTTQTQVSPGTASSVFQGMTYLIPDSINPNIHPTNLSPDITTWTGTGSVGTSASFSASNATNFTRESDGLYLSNFNFNIPSDAIISGITLTLTKNGSGMDSNSSINDGMVQIVKTANGAPAGSWNTNSAGETPNLTWIQNPAASQQSGFGIVQPVLGTVAGAPVGGLFGIQPQSPANFDNHFTNLTFNTHPNSLIPGFGNGSADDDPTFLSQNTTNIQGNYINDIVPQGNGFVCGSHANFPFYNIVYRGAFAISTPGIHEFTFWVQNGWIMAIGPANGTSSVPNNTNTFGDTGGYTNSPFGNYPVLAANNTIHRYDHNSSGFGTPDQAAMNFPVAGVYPFEIGWGGLHFVGDLYSLAIGVDGTRIVPAAPHYSAWAASDTFVSYGSTTDMWNTTLSAADVNNPNFGFLFHAILYKAPNGNADGTGSNTLTATIKNVTATVYYSAESSNPKNDGWGALVASSGKIVVSAAGNNAGIDEAIIGGVGYFGVTQFNETVAGSPSSHTGFHDITGSSTHLFSQSINSIPNYNTSPYAAYPFNNISYDASISGGTLTVIASLNDTSGGGYINDGTYNFNMNLTPTGDTVLVNSWGAINVTTSTGTA